MTLTPGLEQITDRFRQGPAAGAVAGLTVEAALGTIARHYARADKDAAALYEKISTVPVLGGALTGLVNASGTLDFPDRYGPHEGYWWDLARLSCWGFTSGSVSVYKNDTLGVGELVATFPSAGQWSWGHRQQPLAPRDRLVVIAAQVTGTVFVAGSATQVRADHWPIYID